METTQMRFKDLLVSDLGPLPADATINEDLYDLLTLPYSLGTDMNSRFEMYRLNPSNPDIYHCSGTYLKIEISSDVLDQRFVPTTCVRHLSMQNHN